MNEKDFEKLKSSLSKNPGILGRERYFNSAVLVPFVLIGDEYHLIFEKRANGIRQGSEICFPGGGFDGKVDKSFEDTAIRETCEELGLKPDDINIIKQLDTLVGPQGVIVESFLGEVNNSSLSRIKIDKNEVEEFFTIPFSFFCENKPDFYEVRLEVKSRYTNSDGELVTLLPSKELNLPKMYYDTWGFRNRRVIVYNTKPEVVWGLTAEIIYGITSKYSESIF